MGTGWVNMMKALGHLRTVSIEPMILSFYTEVLSVRSEKRGVTLVPDAVQLRGVLPERCLALTSEA